MLSEICLDPVNRHTIKQFPSFTKYLLLNSPRFMTSTCPPLLSNYSGSDLARRTCAPALN